MKRLSLAIAMALLLISLQSHARDERKDVIELWTYCSPGTQCEMLDKPSKDFKPVREELIKKKYIQVQ